MPPGLRSCGEPKGIAVLRVLLLHPDILGTFCLAPCQGLRDLGGQGSSSSASWCRSLSLLSQPV